MYHLQQTNHSDVSLIDDHISKYMFSMNLHICTIKTKKDNIVSILFSCLFQDIGKALHHYEIASEYVYGALADFIRLKYTYEKEYDILGALENMLESYLSSPSVHKTLSYIASYYLFLKGDLIRALDYYKKIMDEDTGSSAITVCVIYFSELV